MNKRTCIIFILLMLLLLSSCTDIQLDWALDVFESWSDAKGVNLAEGVDIGKATGYAAGQAVDIITHSEEYAALEMTAQLKEIERADYLMDRAMASNNPKDLDIAKKTRPYDYKYSEAEAVIWLVNGNNAANSSSITTADSLAAKTVREGGNCRIVRLNQMRVRRNLLLQKLDDPEVKKSSLLQDRIYAEVGNVDIEIEALTSGQPNAFCAGLGADKIPKE